MFFFKKCNTIITDITFYEKNMKIKIFILTLWLFLLNSCATVDIQTNFTPQWNIDRNINVFIDETTYQYNKDTIDEYLSWVLSRGEWSTLVFDDTGTKRIQTKISWKSLSDISSQTKYIFNQTSTWSEQCWFELQGEWLIWGIISRNIHLKESLNTKCLEYVTWISTYSYNGVEFWKIEYPEQTSIDTIYAWITNPTVETILYVLIILWGMILVFIMYLFHIPIITQIIDYIYPSLVKIYYKIVLIMLNKNKTDKKTK